MSENDCAGAYKRVLLKLSGEVFRQNSSGDPIDPAAFAAFAERLRTAHSSGVEVAIVIGGGNIFRGLRGQGLGTDRVMGDTIGMLATMINSIALEAACRNIGLPACVMSAAHMPKISEMYSRDKADRYLSDGRVVILGGGTGNPFFTTDSAAALRAAELGAGALLKATKVDGVYSDDPVKNSSAELYSRITFEDALRQNLRVMDAAAFALCRDNDIPIVVFNFFKNEDLLKVLRGEPAGTLVSN
jgi:uridylate kinase